MKLRRESLGWHYYDRKSGVHCLLDELPLRPEHCDLGPAVVSIALTNACDLDCEFCYASKEPATLRADDVLRWCLELAESGSLEVAFGGGEPTIFPGFGQLCREVWRQSDLGISITTHGHRLTDRVIELLEGNVSIVRFSIDAAEPLYSSIRQRRLSDLLPKVQRTARSVPIGVNTVITKATLRTLDELAAIVADLPVFDWLLLPQVSQAGFALDSGEWATLASWIREHERAFRFSISTQAASYLGVPTLLPEQPRDYAHIDAFGRLRRTSYSSGGLDLTTTDLKSALPVLWSTSDNRSLVRLDVQ